MQQDGKLERKRIGTQQKRARIRKTEMYTPIPKFDVQSQETPFFFRTKMLRILQVTHGQSLRTIDEEMTRAEDIYREAPKICEAADLYLFVLHFHP